MECNLKIDYRSTVAHDFLLNTFEPGFYPALSPVRH